MSTRLHGHGLWDWLQLNFAPLFNQIRHKKSNTESFVVSSQVFPTLRACYMLCDELWLVNWIVKAWCDWSEWFLWFWFDETRRHASKTSLSKLLRPAGGVENGIVIIKEYNAFDLQSVVSVSAIRMSCHQSSIACTRSWILFLPKWLYQTDKNKHTSLIKNNKNN